jgi:hypothetical protein
LKAVAPEIDVDPGPTRLGLGHSVVPVLLSVATHNQQITIHQLKIAARTAVIDPLHVHDDHSCQPNVPRIPTPVFSMLVQGGWG